MSRVLRTIHLFYFIDNNYRHIVKTIYLLRYAWCQNDTSTGVLWDKLAEWTGPSRMAMSVALS